MDNYQNLRDRLILAIKKNITYQDIADIYGVNKGTIHSIVNNENYEPTKPELRSKLGLPVMSEVQSINGEVITGAQTMGSKICIKCGAAFTSNAPKDYLRSSCLVNFELITKNHY